MKLAKITLTPAEIHQAVGQYVENKYNVQVNSTIIYMNRADCSLKRAEVDYKLMPKAE